MIYAINHPNTALKSWYFEPKDLIGNTSQVAEAFRERHIGLEEVIKMLSKINEKEKDGKIERNFNSFCKYSNLARRFSSLLRKAFGEAKILGLLKKEEILELNNIFNRTSKSPSIGAVREVLGFESLRDYVKVNYIESGRLISQVL